MKAKWKDDSSYSRGDTDRTPKSWLLQAGNGVTLIVTRHIHYPPDMWLCYSTIFPQYPLAAKDIELAKEEALKMLRYELQATLEDIQP